jgi:hypothetical protein
MMSETITCGVDSCTARNACAADPAATTVAPWSLSHLAHRLERLLVVVHHQDAQPA